MAYNEFTLDGLIRLFGLRNESLSNAFAGAEPLPLSALLRTTLAGAVPLALEVSTEKARFKFIIAPVLAEAQRHFGGSISLFSGVEFNDQPEQIVGILVSMVQKAQAALKNRQTLHESPMTIARQL